MEEAIGPSYLRATIDPEAHLTLDARINSVPVVTLLDSEATGIFMHPNFAQECQVVIRPKKRPREVQVIDGKVINLGIIIEEGNVELQVEDHQEVCVADITSTGRYPCILGIPWLTCHDPIV